jgi:MiaB-like tRNA modifying enzyme
MPKVLIETYGCTLNQADSDIMEGILEGRGFEVARGNYDENAKKNYDFVIVNTCTVKKATEQKIRDKLRTMSHLGERLVVTGCMASANRDMIEEVVEEASVVSTNNVTRIYDVLKELEENGKVRYDDAGREDKSHYIPVGNSVISRIPVSEGCLSNCNFCETKYARGPLNSFSEKLILKAIEMNVRSGAKEIEITSQDIGAYGADKKTDIARLVSQASEIDGDFRIRIGMLNPEHLHKYIDGLIEAYKSEKIYKFIHLPVQSGSDKVLREMKRHYTIGEFSGYVNELRKKMPEMCIETDLIVGYPTETDGDFEETIRIVDELRPTITNISKFGLRPHTEAVKLKQLPGSVIKERSIRLARMIKRMQQEEFSKFRGRRMRVLLTEVNGSSITGRTDSYIAVAVNNVGKESLGKFVDAEIFDNSYACLIGKAFAYSEIQSSRLLR